MFVGRRNPVWPVDPSNVTFGSVVDCNCGNLSRSHVLVKYLRESVVRLVPTETFIVRCREALRRGRPLEIERLQVAPILKRRYAKFFDGLTDWGPATRRALSQPPLHGHDASRQWGRSRE